CADFCPDGLEEFIPANDRLLGRRLKNARGPSFAAKQRPKYPVSSRIDKRSYKAIIGLMVSVARNSLNCNRLQATNRCNRPLVYLGPSLSRCKPDAKPRKRSRPGSNRENFNFIYPEFGPRLQYLQVSK